MPGSDGSRNSSLNQVAPHLIAGMEKNEDRHRRSSGEKDAYSSIKVEMSGQGLDQSYGESDEGAGPNGRNATGCVRRPLDWQADDNRNSVSVKRTESRESAAGLNTTILRDRGQGYQLVKADLSDAASAGRSATNAGLAAVTKSPYDDEVVKQKCRAPCSGGNPSLDCDKRIRTNSTTDGASDTDMGKSGKGCLDNGRKGTEARDKGFLRIVRKGSNEITASSFGAGSLMDVDEDVSVYISYSGSIGSSDLEESVKNQLGNCDMKQCAPLHHNCSSPPPSCAESSSNSSSSSSKELTVESCTELVNRGENATSIFRGRSYSNVSSSRRIANQDSGVNSLISRSEALSISSEELGKDDTKKGDGLSVSFTPLSRIPYVHGSYSTAAPMMLHDTKWMRILRHLMPESHADAVTMLCQELKSGSVVFPNAVRVMKWAENNPVVAAYGIMNSDAGRNTGKRERRRPATDKIYSPRLSMNMGPPTAARRGGGRNSSPAGLRHKPMLEWDVFLDPNLVRKVDFALQAVNETRKTCSHDEVAQIAAEVEVDRQVGRLISRMVLAHGSTSQLVAEAVGFSSRHNFASVVEQGESQRLHRRRRKLKRDESLSRSGLINAWKADRAALARRAENHIVPLAPGKGSAKGAGIFVERWMAIFATALRLAEENGQIDDSESLSNYGHLLDSLEQDVEIRQVKPSMCGMFLCLGYEDPNSTKADHSKTSMATSAMEVLSVLGSQLTVVLDLKSRRVPPRVWARLVDTLRSRGIGVGGLGSFDIDELRTIGSYCTAPVTGVIFFHSAGDLQRACHSKEVHRGDTVYFNAGSLILPKPNIMAKMNCCQSEHYLPRDALDTKEDVVFQPYAFPRHKIPKSFVALECKSTLQDYQRWFHLNIGVYVQEFSISDRTLDAISKLVNDNPSIYNLGLAWGGINGKTSPGVPGDGYWNQRYMGRTWDTNAEPTDSMNLLHIEDHRLVKKAFRAGAWGHIGMVNPVNDLGGDATGDGATLNFEPCRPME